MRRFFESFEQRDLLTATLLHDINQLAAESSRPREFVEVGDVTFFVAESDLGTELWKTDGTELGTSIVVDLEPGSASSFPHTLIPLEQRLLFHVGQRVWSTDGTEAGTVKLDAVRPILAANASYAFDGMRITNGTPEGTLQALDSSGSPLVPGSNPEMIAKVDSFYMQTDQDLFRVDHNATATKLQVGNESNRLLRPHEGTRLLDAHDGPLVVSLTGHQLGLYKLDEGEPLIEVPGQTLDVAFAPNRIVTSNGVLPTAVVANNITFFETFESATITLWRTDGTVDGTYSIANFHEQGEEPNAPTSSILRTAIVAEDSKKIWFLAYDEEGDAELWSSDGSQPGTTKLDALLPGSTLSVLSNLHLQGETLWFVADGDGDDTGAGGRQLWMSDGSSAGTRPVTNFTGPTHDTEPILLGVNDQTVFFRGRSEDGIELWKFENDALQQVRDILPGSRGSLPANFFEAKNGLHFFSAAGVTGIELWRTDGTEDGTQLVKDIHTSLRTGHAAPNNFVAFGDRLYFAADDGLNGSELWSYDGSSVEIVADVNPGELGSFPKNLTASKDSLFFTANRAEGNAVWRLDTAGAVTQIEGTLGTNPEELAIVDDSLFFTGITKTFSLRQSSEPFQRGVWSVEGNEARIHFVPNDPDEAPRSSTGTVEQLHAFNNQLYFFEFDPPGSVAVRLHRLTPSAAGTVGHEILAESGPWIRGGPLGMWSTQDQLLIAGPNEDLANNFGFWLADNSGRLVPVDLAQHFGRARRDLAPPLSFTTTSDAIRIHDASTRSPNGLIFKSDGIVEAFHETEPILEVLETANGWYFVRDSTNGPSVLFSADGTLKSATTIHNAQSSIRATHRRPQQLTDSNGRVYFLLDDGQGLGVQIYSSDGSPESPRLETTIGPKAVGLGPSQLLVFQDDLLFVADDGVRGLELWKLSTRERGDINADGLLNVDDIDAFYATIRTGQTELSHDINADQSVDEDDANLLISEILGICHGDATANGTVDFQDFLVLAINFGTEETDIGWKQGDFNGDARVDFTDFLTLAEKFGCDSRQIA